MHTHSDQNTCERTTTHPTSRATGEFIDIETGFAAESGQNDEYRTFSQKSIFIFCTTISTNPQGFRIKIDESETKMPEDRVGALSRSTWQPEIA
jgi:hypothetical protein